MTGDYQPYWRAWCHSLDAPYDNPGRPNHEYIAWITSQWAEWRAETGIPETWQGAHADEFTAWLAARWPAPMERAA